MAVSCAAASWTSVAASAAVPGAAPAGAGARTPVAAADQDGAEGQHGAETAPGGRASGLHRPPPSASAGPGEGATFHARWKRTVGIRCRQVANDARRGKRRSHPARHTRPRSANFHSRRPFPGAEEYKTTAECAQAGSPPECTGDGGGMRQAVDSRGSAPRRASGGGGPAQPARGSCACRPATVSRSRRIAASSSAVHGSQQSQRLVEAWRDRGGHRPGPRRSRGDRRTGGGDRHSPRRRGRDPSPR